MVLGSLAVVALLLLGGCASAARPAEIAGDRAMEIGRAQVRWAPFDFAARRTRAAGRPIWRVTLKGRLSGQPPGLFETAVIDIDAVTAVVIRIAKS